MENTNDANKLKERIEFCLEGLNYPINEPFFKRTLSMMLDYIEQTNKQLDEYAKQTKE
jgi:hypothetical protein